MNFKRTLAVLMLFITLLLFVLQFFAFRLFVASNKEFLIADALKSKGTEIHTVTISSSDLYRNMPGFEWKEKNRELCINGRYFEVLKIELCNKQAILYLVNDKKENELFRSFYEHSNKKHQGFILQCLLGFSESPGLTIELNPFWREEEMRFAIFKQNTLRGYFQVLILPPKPIV